MDYITLDRFKIQGIHGYFEHERRVEQEFEVSIKMACDTKRAAASDKLEDAVDYGAVKAQVEVVFKSKKYYLLEALAEDTAAAILNDPRITEVTISIQKTAVWPDAVPGVIITRRRQGPVNRAYLPAKGRRIVIEYK